MPSAYDSPTVRPPTRPDGAFIFIGWLLGLASLICIVFGWWRMYRYDEFTDKIVGGDAYNYAIIATRGAGIITAGVGLGVLAVLFVGLAIAERMAARTNQMDAR